MLVDLLAPQMWNSVSRTKQNGYTNIPAKSWTFLLKFKTCFSSVYHSFSHFIVFSSSWRLSFSLGVLILEEISIYDSGIRWIFSYVGFLGPRHNEVKPAQWNVKAFVSLVRSIRPSIRRPEVWPLLCVWVPVIVSVLGSLFESVPHLVSWCASVKQVRLSNENKRLNWWALRSPRTCCSYV